MLFEGLRVGFNQLVDYAHHYIKLLLICQEACTAITSIRHHNTTLATTCKIPLMAAIMTVTQRIAIMSSPKNLHHNQAGFIPLLLSILAIVVIGIIFVYIRVLKAQH